MNITILTGRVGSAPKVHSKVVTFSVAQGSGDSVQWFPIACFEASETAFRTASRLWSGALVSLSGYLRVKNFEGQTRFEVVATHIETLSKPPAADPAETGGPGADEPEAGPEAEG